MKICCKWKFGDVGWKSGSTGNIRNRSSLTFKSLNVQDRNFVKKCIGFCRKTIGTVVLKRCWSPFVDITQLYSFHFRMNFEFWLKFQFVKETMLMSVWRTFQSFNSLKKITKLLCYILQSLFKRKNQYFRTVCILAFATRI